MKLKEAFITHETDGVQVLIDTAGKFSGLVRSNPTAAFIVEQLKQDTTVEKIVEAMLQKYDAPEEVIRKDVTAIMEKLKKIGAIDD